MTSTAAAQSDYEAILGVARTYEAMGLEVAWSDPNAVGLSYIGVSNRKALPGLETSGFVPLVRFAFRDGKYVDGEAMNFDCGFPPREDFERDLALSARKAIEALAWVKVPDKSWSRSMSDFVNMLIERGANGRFMARPVRFGDEKPEAS